MLLNISKYLTNYFVNKHIIEFDKTDIFIYGFQLALSTFASIITILTLSCFTNIIYGIIFLLFFMPIRFCAGGYHANTYHKCFIYTNLCFIITMLFSKLALQYHLLHIYMPPALLGILYLWWKAPCRNTNNPLSEISLYKNKIYARTVLIIYCLFSIITYFLNTFIFLVEFDTVFLVSILFIIGNLENRHETS